MNIDAESNNLFRNDSNHVCEEKKELRKKRTFLLTMNFVAKSVQVNLSYN